MANLKSSKKKARKDIKLTGANRAYRAKLDVVAKRIKKGDTAEQDISSSYQAIDKAAKRKIISKQKAARLKSRVGRKS